jgi:hypothetical protein
MLMSNTHNLKLSQDIKDPPQMLSAMCCDKRNLEMVREDAFKDFSNCYIQFLSWNRRVDFVCDEVGDEPDLSDGVSFIIQRQIPK